MKLLFQILNIGLQVNDTIWLVDYKLVGEIWPWMRKKEENDKYWQYIWTCFVSFVFVALSIQVKDWQIK